MTLNGVETTVERLWEQLSMYESQDLCRRFFHQKHGLHLSAEKATEVCAHISHGRAYFESAVGATDTVRPLLLYYGVQALCRGLVLFLDPRMRESSLAPSHGLQTDSWSNVLAGGIRHVTELRLKPSRGSLMELVRVTSNVDYTLVGHRWSAEVFSGSASLSSGFGPTLREILARIPDLVDSYEQTLEEHAWCYPVTIGSSIQSSHLAEIVFSPSLAGVLRVKELTQRLQLSPSVILSETDSLTPQGYVKAPSCRVPWDSWHGVLHMVNDRRGSTYVIAPFSSGERLSQLTLFFLMAYSLGMLVRYHPTTWTQMLMRGSGDYAVPLIRAAITSVEARFPELLLRELVGHSPERHKTQ